MRIAAVGTAFPPHYHDQDTLLEALRRLWSERHHNLDRLERLHRNVLVGGRHLALPIDAYERLDGFRDANDRWIEAARDLGTVAIEAALDAAGVAPHDVDVLMVTTVTGLSTPSLDALLCNRIPFRPDVKRIPLFGLGCMAGAAGVARAADFLRGHPDATVVFLAVELCSLTLQREDLSIPNLIASGLFGDGAAAVVLRGARTDATGPTVLDSRSVFYPDTERIMGWDISERGFRLVLSADLPGLIVEHLRSDVDGFLSAHGLDRNAIDPWLCHPGGPKVLEAVGRALELADGELDRSWRSLREVGNLSSVSVLLVLADALSERVDGASGHGLLLAMGPGFSSELVLLDWGGR
jgi:alkylresorcinol/alkylpyrone synthase